MTDTDQIEVANLKREIQTLNQDVKDLYLDVLSVLGIFGRIAINLSSLVPTDSVESTWFEIAEFDTLYLKQKIRGELGIENSIHCKLKENLKIDQTERKKRFLQYQESFEQFRDRKRQSK